MRLAAILLLGVFSANAFAISGVRRVAKDEYIGRYTNTDPRRAADFPAGVKTQIIVLTGGCKHVPGRHASAVIDGSAIWFSDGGRCAVRWLTTENTKDDD